MLGGHGAADSTSASAKRASHSNSISYTTMLIPKVVTKEQSPQPVLHII